MSSGNNRTMEVTINGTLFVLNRMDAFEALAVFGDLQKELLPALGELLGGALAGSADSDSAQTTARAIERLASRLSGAQLTAWANRLLTADTVSVEINGNMIRLDSSAKQLAFQEFTDILELLWHTINLNFAGPLSAFLSRFGLDLRKLTAANQSESSERIS